MKEANCNLTIDEAIQVSKRFLRQMAQPFSRVSLYKFYTQAAFFVFVIETKEYWVV